MTSKKIWLLIVFTLLLLPAAILVTQNQKPQTHKEKILLFPDLINQINDVDSISIERQNEVLNLKKKNGSWRIVDNDYYPALLDHIKQTLITIANLKVLSKKTKNPKQYAKLGVEDPSIEKATSSLVTLRNAQGDILANLIIGKQQFSKSAKNKTGQYVRKPSDKTALLVSAITVLNPSVNAIDWFERTLFDIPADRVKKITIQPANDTPFILEKSNKGEKDFLLQDKPNNQVVVSPIILNRFGSLLQQFRVDGVSLPKKIDFPDKFSTAKFETFDGLLISIDYARVDKKIYARISTDTSIAPNLSTEETVDIDSSSHSLNEILSGWLYELPDYKYEILGKKKADLFKK